MSEVEEASIRSPENTSQSLVIWKFPINWRGAQMMPAGAKILDFHEQGGEPFVWALVDAAAPMVDRHLTLVGTGIPIPEFAGEYIGTAHLPADGLVLHLFDGAEAS